MRCELSKSQEIPGGSEEIPTGFPQGCDKVPTGFAGGLPKILGLYSAPPYQTTFEGERSP